VDASTESGDARLVLSARRCARGSLVEYSNQRLEPPLGGDATGGATVGADPELGASVLPAARASRASSLQTGRARRERAAVRTRATTRTLVLFPPQLLTALRGPLTTGRNCGEPPRESSSARPSSGTPSREGMGRREIRNTTGSLASRVWSSDVPRIVPRTQVFGSAERARPRLARVHFADNLRGAPGGPDGP
jgi:hypothetical protein